MLRLIQAKAPDALLLHAESETSFFVALRKLCPLVSKLIGFGKEPCDINAIKAEFPSTDLTYLPYPFKKSLKEYIDDIKGADVRFVTYGPFDAYHKDTRVIFHSKKAKELLAIMVAYPSSTMQLNHIISLLWPGHDPFLAKRLYRDAALRLRATLKEYGIESLIEFGHASCFIHKEKARCEYWDELVHKPSEPYYGQFMVGYSWATPIQTKLSSFRR